MTGDEQIEAIHQAIQTTLGGFCTKWVLVAEVAEDDGSSSLRTLNDADAALWDTIGLLRFAQRMAEVDARDTYAPLGEEDDL